MLLLLLMLAATAEQPAPAVTGCVACHAAQQEPRVAAPASLYRGPDVHRERGFTCVDCHGGDPAAGDAKQAHDASRGFKGKPAGEGIIATCARCHSDAELMRRSAPKQRVDQASEYATSVHGKRLAAGDHKVATCATCHGAHGVRLVSDAKSPVFPTNVANTCASCHADAGHMAGYTLPGGSPLPTTQAADYRKSVHFEALTKGNDLSAPTCNDCHGNHGAAPPGVGAIANVCGTCHAVFAQKFEPSAHSQIFDKGCVECHSNHAVLKPSDEMIGSAGPGICASCHDANDKSDKGVVAADRMRGDIEQLKAALGRSHATIARLRNAGIEVGDDELSLREAASKLTLARTELHSFEPARVSAVIADGLNIVSTVDQSGERGLGELRYRRRGLAWSLAAILLVVVSLGFKLRQIDARQ